MSHFPLRDRGRVFYLLVIAAARWRLKDITTLLAPDITAPGIAQ
jgi:hypothetical protein